MNFRLLSPPLLLGFAALIGACSSNSKVEVPEGAASAQQASGDAQQKGCLRMVGGVEKDEHPETFIIASELTGQTGIYEFCTATWVAHNWALTSAHCITDTAFTNPKTFKLSARKVATGNDAFQSLKTAVRALRVVRPADIYAGKLNPNDISQVKRDVAYLEFPANSSSRFLPIDPSVAGKPVAPQSVVIAGFGVRSFADAGQDIFAVGGLYPQTFTHKVSPLPGGIDPAPYAESIFISSPGGAGIPLPGDSGGPILAQGKVVGTMAVFLKNSTPHPAAIYTSLSAAAVVAVTAEAVAAGMKLGESQTSGGTTPSAPSGSGAEGESGEDGALGQVNESEHALGKGVAVADEKPAEADPSLSESDATINCD